MPSGADPAALPAGLTDYLREHSSGHCSLAIVETASVPRGLTDYLRPVAPVEMSNPALGIDLP